MRRLLTSPPAVPEEMSTKDELAVVLAFLLFALICFLGMFAVSRCARIRRLVERITGRPDRGLEKKVIGTLPVFAFSAAEHAGKFVDCAICLTVFAAGDMIRVMPQCGHGYHAGCIDKWLGSRSSCPSCRKILLTVWCEKCGAKDSPAARPVDGLEAAEMRRPVTVRVKNFFLPIGN